MFWFAMFISLIGTWVQGMAQSWFIFSLTRSAFLMGLVGFVGYLPVTLFSMIAGVLGDRIQKRDLLLLTQSCLMSVAFIFALLVHLELIRVWCVFILVFLSGCALAFDGPVRQSFIFELVGRRHLMNAVSLNSASFNLARILGPSLAGILIGLVGIAGCFYLNALSFLPVICVLFFLKSSSHMKLPAHHSIWSDFKQGVALIGRNRQVLALLGLVAMLSMFGAAHMILMPIFVQDVLGSGPMGLGVLMSANGIGALLGALHLARQKDVSRPESSLKSSVLILLGALLCFSLSTSFVLSAALLVFAGFGAARSLTIANVVLQVCVEDAFRGRLMGFFMTVFTGVLPFGYLLTGGLAHFVGPQLVVFSGALINLAFFLFIEGRYLKSFPDACPVPSALAPAVANA